MAAGVRGEDATVYAYGVIGAHLSGASRTRARRALDAHRLARQQLQGGLKTQVAVAPAYDLPFPVTDAESARRLAVLVEEALVPVYADIARTTTADVRANAVTEAMQCATRAISWGGSSSAFPGA